MHTYSSDNTNSTIGQCRSLLQKIQSTQRSQNIFDVGCPCNLAHLRAGKGEKELCVNIEDFLLTYAINFTGVQNKKNS